MRFALKRVSRVLTTRQRQAAPIGADDARMILRLAGTKPAELRDLALLLVMRDLLARRSELVALTVADVQPSDADDGSGTALIRRSKTDQDGEGAVGYLSPHTMGVLTAWLEAAGITRGPLFRAVNRHGQVGTRALGSDDVARRFSGATGAKGVARYAGSAWLTMGSGASGLADALAIVDCDVDEIIERHSHAILLGAVRDVQQASGALQPLVYGDGQFGRFAPI